MAIVSEVLIGDLIKHGLIDKSKLNLLPNSKAAKYKQLVKVIEKGYNPTWLSYTTITELDKHNLADLTKAFGLGGEAIAQLFYPDGVQNAIRVLGKIAYNKLASYNAKETLNNLKLWQDYPRGRDLFIPGFGAFNTAKAYSDWYDDMGRYRVLPSPHDLILKGYLNAESLWRCRDLYKPLKHVLAGKRAAAFEYILKNPSLAPRFDELEAWIVLNPGRQIPSNIVERLDDMVIRNLRVTAADHVVFEYQKLDSKIREIMTEAGYVLPKNGIELKQAAQEFKNCAGGYVSKVANGTSAIFYRPDAMVELSGSGHSIRQAFGPRNTSLSVAADTELRGLLGQ